MDTKTTRSTHLDHTVHEVYTLLDLEFGLQGITDDDQLIDDGHLDSLSVVELVLLLEETFGTVIDEGQVTVESFATVPAIASLVETCR